MTSFETLALSVLGLIVAVAAGLYSAHDCWSCRSKQPRPPGVERRCQPRRNKTGHRSKGGRHA